MTHLSEHDLEQLSAYIDGELEPAEAAELETRLNSEPKLKRTLAQLSWVSGGLRSLPAERAPRRFTLTPEMVGQSKRGWRLPALRLATATLALALVAVIGLDFMRTTGGMRLAASAPQEMEAPAVMQDNFAADQAAEKAGDETLPLGEAQAGAVQGTPMAEAMRSAGGTPETDASSAAEATPMAMAVPPPGVTEEGTVSEPSPTPTPPEEVLTDRVSRLPTARGVDVLRLTEFVLGAGLLILLGVQIGRRR
jgi:anti-sigma factor RsiW